MSAPSRASARVAGAALLAGLAIVLAANFGVSERLIVADDPAATVRNIAAHEGLFRSNVAGFLAYAGSLLVLLTIFYETLRPVHRGLALFAALCRLVYAFGWMLTALDVYAAVRLVNRPGYAALLGDRLPGVVRVTLGAGYEHYYAGLLFQSIGSVIVCGLLWRSRLVPRALAAAGVLAYAWCALTTIGFIALPGFGKVVDPWLYDTPMGLFEIALGIRLLAKGWSTEVPR